MRRSDQVSAINANTTDVSRANRIRILQYLRDDMTHTRIEIARALKMSPATVNRLSRRMTELGLIVKVGEDGDGRGRPADLIRFNPDAFQVVAVSVHTKFFKLAEVNLDGAVSATVSVPHSGETAASVVEAMQTALTDYLQNRNSSSPLWAIGIAVPGIVDNTGTVEFEGSLGWEAISFAGRLETVFGVPVVVENYCNLVALAEYHVGGHDEFSSLVAICGCAAGGIGIVLGGDLWRGAHGAAGVFNEPKAAGSADTSGGPAQEGVPSLCSVLTDDSPANDASFEAVLDLYARRLANVCSVLDPECLLVTGKASRSRDRLIPELQTRLEALIPHVPLIVPSGLGSEGRLIGAALGAMRQIGGIGSLF